VLSSQLHFALLLHKLGSGDLANGALEISGQLLGGVNVTTNTANKLLHNYILQKFYVVIYSFRTYGSQTSMNSSAPEPQMGHTKSSGSSSQVMVKTQLLQAYSLQDQQILNLRQI
jgi:hypothetical protein